MTVEILLDYWEDQRYEEIETELRSRPLDFTVDFVDKLVKYKGVQALDFLNRLFN